VIPHLHNLHNTDPLRAAQYVRMSTEHQQYSPQNQSDAIAAYASLQGMEIVQTYADHGRSGLDLAGRVGLRTLLDDVASRRNNFSVLLVYDISRWGRFQDADESAYYEYVLKRAGIRIHYCAEQFVNDGSLPSALFKTLKRTMAGEYSRELSVKVFAGQCRLIELGFRQGGLAGYGLKRQLLDKDGNPKAWLALREHKSIQTDRVILTPGPEAEIAVVALIYRSFITLRKGETEIATDLNARGFKTHYNRPWSNSNVHEVLINPKYIGANVYNRKSFKLRQHRVRNPPEMWIKRESAFEPIVSTEDFETVQAIIHARNQHLTDEDMLDRLRDLLKTCGRLSSRLIDESVSMPFSRTYAKRFGGLLRAYALVGWRCTRDFGHIGINRTLRLLRSALIESIVSDVKGSGGTIHSSDRDGVLIINGEFTALILIARCYQRPSGHQWRIRCDLPCHADIVLVARLEAGNKSTLDYYVFPSFVRQKRLRLTHNNSLAVDAYRFEDLKFFLGLCRRTSIEGAA
jgi:DNA invertase Pin-like site-specific DNA recombinase